ncbi:SMP-30/gluconolactonase/LRE family protein [uncultured Pseudacidovorax sp.]|uniref:SMP-30/gluconolactonase/LRE family protein n=1 Tax=uncultured Pseudacidovorax sp. TaxID=679313 RepID=UPI0025F1F89D|nr:SMP-30/gluconolactonase/LRE family protein [uncultured Pseudacidovorax sp.]
MLSDSCTLAGGGAADTARMQPPHPDIRRLGTTRDQLGESPCWDAEAQALCWIDALVGTVHRLVPATGMLASHALPAPLGAIAPAQGDAVVVALRHGFGRYDFGTRQMTMLGDIGLSDVDVRLNDGKCDAAGNFVAGTMHMNRPEGASVRGGLYRLRPEGRVEQLADDIGFANGPCFSPDGRTLYVADSLARVIWAYDYDPQGPLANKRCFVETHGFDSGPDGATVDAEGFVWSVLVRAAQLARFSPDGMLERCVPLPLTYPTSLCFGGPGYAQLYVTSISRSARLEGPLPQDGGLFVVDGLPAVGLPTRRFGG